MILIFSHHWKLFIGKLFILFLFRESFSFLEMKIERNFEHHLKEKMRKRRFAIQFKKHPYFKGEKKTS